MLLSVAMYRNAIELFLNQSQSIRNLEHTLDGADGLYTCFLVDLNGWSKIFEREVEFFKGDELHVGTLVAGAASIVGRSWNELLVGAALLHLIDDATLGGNYKLVAVAGNRVVEQSFGGANLVGNEAYGLWALRVNEHMSVGVLLLELHNLLNREFLVHLAVAVPHHHVAACDAVDVVAQVAVGTEDELLILGEAVDNLLGVAAGHYHIGESLDGSTGISVADNSVSWVLLDERLKLIGRTTVAQRAARVEVGHYNSFLRAQNFSCLAHEMHATEHYHRRFHILRQLCQCQAVANVVGKILNFVTLVEVRHNNSILLLFEFYYLFTEVYSFGNRSLDITFINIHNIIICFKYFRI